MGVSKGEGGGRWSPPNGWRSLVFGRRRSLSDLAVWGFPEISRKIFPLKPFFPLPNPFFSLSILAFNPSTPQTPPSIALAQAFISPCYLSYPPFPPPTLIGPYWTPSEHLRNPSIGSPKGPKTALFRPF